MQTELGKGQFSEVRYGLLKTNLTRSVAIKVNPDPNPNPNLNPNPNPNPSPNP